MSDLETLKHKHPAIQAVLDRVQRDGNRALPEEQAVAVLADALDTAFPDPDSSSPEWERMGTAGARFAGYLTALTNSNSIRWDEGRHLAEKALVDFLKHIGYDEVAGLYQKTMEKFV